MRMTGFAWKLTGAAALAFGIVGGTAAFGAEVSDATVAFLMPDQEIGRAHV